MTDEELARDVIDVFRRDPRIDSSGIAVSAQAGTVTLRGTVDSFHQKREATRAAERVHGVSSVHNCIDVEILPPGRREDADLRGDVLEALMLDSLVPTSVDARTTDGCVTLSGEVDWEYQREEAERVAGNVPGVTAVLNEILYRDTTEVARDVEARVREAFVGDATLDAGRLQVTVSQGIITLTGQVHSSEQHDAALVAAWSAPGIRQIDDRLTVAY